ncbi:MAG: hypothetical protein F4Y26_01375 [Gammaproteobacteria bacterium]|nr:hypothetical protein [Gammaproteobacteria bacterium]
MAAAAHLATLSPGALAELRRMAEDDVAPAFWRLVARHDAIRAREDEWMHIVRILAILTPKGDPDKRTSLHSDRRLGTVLCDGGDPSWADPKLGEPRPAYSATRFDKLLASRDPQRTVLLTRAARMVAKAMVAGTGVNVRDIAFAILYPDSAKVNNALARSYYSRLDGAAGRASNQEDSA